MRLLAGGASAVASENQRAPVAQLDRASDYGSEGWEFESLRARHDASLFQRIGVGGAWRSPVSAPGSVPGGRWFKSTRPDHPQKEPTRSFCALCASSSAG